MSGRVRAAHGRSARRRQRGPVRAQDGDVPEANRPLFIVEGRSTTRRRQIEKRLEKLGVTRPGKKASDEEQEDYARTLMLHQLADQVVHPKGVTAEGLEALMEANEPAVDLIFSAAQRANSVAAKAPVTPDFSRGR